MKRFLFPLALALSCLTAFAQNAPDLTTKDLVAQIGPLRVARTLQLREDQMAQMQPILAQVKAAREALKAAQDAIFARTGQSLARADQALQVGQRATQADLNAADRASRDNKAALADMDKAVNQAADQVYKLLDRDQLKLVETQQQQRARNQDDTHSGGASLANTITGYVVAMRQLLPEEYNSLRVAMGLRLAGLLVSPDNPNYNTAVGDVLRVMDTVRQMSDADFAQRQAELPQAIGRALRLNVAAAGPTAAISYDQFVDFVAGDQTAQALAAYVPASPKGAQ